MAMFRIDVLPAQRGDALWITYGPTDGPHHHVLVDAGPQETIPTLVPELARVLLAIAAPAEDASRVRPMGAEQSNTSLVFDPGGACVARYDNEVGKGDGIAIEPSDTVLRAPCAGRVVQVHAARHACVIEAHGGARVLLHIGLDTVLLKGEGFIARVEPGLAVEIRVQAGVDAVEPGHPEENAQ